jgi:metallophosphoesterase superfamily enzyme
MGHIHPFFNNSNSVIHGKRLWIYLKIKKESIFGLKTKGTIEIIIVPTFNKYFYSLRYPKESRSISPLIRQLLKKDAILSGLLFTLEGSLISEIHEIKNIF